MHQNHLLEDATLKIQNEERKNSDDVTTNQLNKMKSCFVSIELCSLQNAKTKIDTNNDIISSEGNFYSQSKGSSNQSNNHSGNLKSCSFLAMTKCVIIGNRSGVYIPKKLSVKY